ncbi:hypothetical protein SCOR_23900 [Sulfidibacter corallicola]
MCDQRSHLPGHTGRAIPAVPYRPCTTTLSGIRDHHADSLRVVSFSKSSWVCPLVRGSYMTSFVRSKGKDENLSIRMCGECDEKDRPSALGGPGTYCDNAPLRIRELLRGDSGVRAPSGDIARMGGILL